MKAPEFPLKTPASSAGYSAIIPVRWSDMDSYHHINNAKMATLIEEARINWLFTKDSITHEMAQGTVVTDMRIRYQEQVRYHEGPLHITMWITQLRAVDFTIYYEVRSAHALPHSRPAVVASTQLATFDIATQQLRRMTTQEHEYLESFRR